MQFPKRELSNVNYELTAAYPDVYREIVGDIEKLHLVPYNIAAYRKKKSEEDERLADRGDALIGIQKTLFLKRLESSVAAFRQSVRNHQDFQRRFCEFLAQEKLLGAADVRELRCP